MTCTSSLDLRFLIRANVYCLYSPELEVYFWEHMKFLKPQDSGPPRFIQPNLIISQACRLTIDKPRSPDLNYDSDGEAAANPRAQTSEKAWATIGLTRVCVLSHDQIASRNS
jgi:hypothetical protein